MKKTSFLKGAAVTTIGIVICKIIGLLYVIPLRNIIGEQGGALYGYAYSFYGVFLSLSSSGIPLAISKIVSEYDALGYHYLKKRVYKIANYIIGSLGVILFFTLFLSAPFLAKLILGDLTTGNTLEGVTLVLRVISFALLVVPLLSVAKGYLQGHKFMTETSLATILEQLVRVSVILIGGFAALHFFKLSLEATVGVIVFGATVGGLVAYFYLITKILKNRENVVISRAERKVTTKQLVLKILSYALPFIIIELVKSANSIIDTLTVVSTLATLGYAQIAETTIGILNVWASKLNMIIISISIGITISLTPNLSSSFVSKDMKDVSHKINQALQLILFTSLPMTVGLAFLSGPVWTVFYGYDLFSINLMQVFVFQALTFSIYSILINASQTLNETKFVLSVLAGSFLAKAILNIPMMHLFHNLKIGVQYAPVILNICIQIIVVIIIMFVINKKYKIKYKETFKTGFMIILSTLIMVVVLKILYVFVPLTSFTRGGALIEILVYSLVGALVYFVCVLKSGVVYNIFGFNFLERIKNIIKK